MSLFLQCNIHMSLCIALTSFYKPFIHHLFFLSILPLSINLPFHHHLSLSSLPTTFLTSFFENCLPPISRHGTTETLRGVRGLARELGEAVRLLTAVLVFKLSVSLLLVISWPGLGKAKLGWPGRVVMLLPPNAHCC